MIKAKTILIIEDNADSLYLYNEILKSENFNVICTGNGPDALKYLNEKKDLPHLIILDLNFPFMTAQEFIQILKSEVNWVKIPIIIISGQMDTQQRSVELKADGFIVKPFELDEFISTVHNYTSKSYG